MTAATRWTAWCGAVREPRRVLPSTGTATATATAVRGARPGDSPSASMRPCPSSQAPRASSRASASIRAISRDSVVSAGTAPTRPRRVRSPGARWAVKRQAATRLRAPAVTARTYRAGRVPSR
ncbi:hypothetical protein Z951_31930 [Streptomyces sp. PRh5]|nr:hypothetical protein Z951_31930 [Streptomyces sp. PRh5]